jgi:hypothetical protein
VRLRLDHLILRSADPAATLAELARRSGAPVLAEAEELVGAIASGIVRAGSVDLEVLRIGGLPPERVLGYGLGFVADVPLMEAVGELRTLGLPVSPPAPAEAGEGEQRRPWRAAQVHGLLPNPFPAPATTRKPGVRDRVAGAAAGTLGRIGPLARAGTNDPGDSMVVLTEYGFDVEAWRARVSGGPDVVGVEIGTVGAREAWERLPLDGAVALQLRDDGPAGIRRVTLSGARKRPFTLGAVRFEWGGR